MSGRVDGDTLWLTEDLLHVGPNLYINYTIMDVRSTDQINREQVAQGYNSCIPPQGPEFLLWLMA